MRVLTRPLGSIKFAHVPLGKSKAHGQVQTQCEKVVLKGVNSRKRDSLGVINVTIYHNYYVNK